MLRSFSASKCDPIEPPLNAECDHDVTDIARNVMVTCRCTGSALFWHGLPVLTTMCDSQGVWLPGSLDCVGKQDGAII